MKLTPRQIIDKVEAKSGFTHRTVKKVLKSYFDVMVECLQQEGEFCISKVGTISLYSEGGDLKDFYIPSCGWLKSYNPYRIFFKMRFAESFKDLVLFKDAEDVGIKEITQDYIEQKNKNTIEKEARNILLQDMFRQGKEGETIDGGYCNNPVETAKRRGLLIERKKNNGETVNVSLKEFLRKEGVDNERLL